MDEAAVSTIHGWCNRMLREHAFDSGSLFTQTLEADQAELLDEAVRDYWRTFFYPLAADDAARCAGWWADAQRCCRRSASCWRLARCAGARAPNPRAALRHGARGSRAASWPTLKAPWAGMGRRAAGAAGRRP